MLNRQTHLVLSGRLTGGEEDLTALIPIYAISCFPALLPKEILGRFGKNTDNLLWIISLLPTIILFALWGNRLAETLALSQNNHTVITHLGSSASIFEKLIYSILGQGSLEFVLILINFYFLASFFANRLQSEEKLVLHRSRAMFSIILLIGLPFFFSEQYYNEVTVLVSSIGFNEDILIYSIVSYLGMSSLLIASKIWSKATINGDYSKLLVTTQVCISGIILVLIANSNVEFSIYREVVLFSTLGLVVIPMMSVLLAVRICNENNEKTRIKQSNQIIVWVLAYGSSFVVLSLIYSKLFANDLIGLAILFYSLGNVCIIISATLPFMALPYLGYDSQTFAEFTHLRYVTLFIPALMIYSAEFPQMLVFSVLGASLIGIIVSWAYSRIWPDNDKSFS